MHRVATFECGCCQGRQAKPLAPGQRGPRRLHCERPCYACHGPCKGTAERTGTEKVTPAPPPPLLTKPALGNPTVPFGFGAMGEWQPVRFWRR